MPSIAPVARPTQAEPVYFVAELIYDDRDILRETRSICGPFASYDQASDHQTELHDSYALRVFVIRAVSPINEGKRPFAHGHEMKRGVAR